MIKGKGELLDALPDNGVAVLNADSPGFNRWRKRSRCSVLSLGQTGGDIRWQWHSEDSSPAGRLELGDRRWRVPLPGVHNAANLAAAVVAAGAAGLSQDEMWGGLRDFEPSPHRSHLLEVGGLQILDDSYNANPTSLRAAAEGLDALPGGGRTIAVLGAMAELGAASGKMHRDVGSGLIDTGLDLLLTVGDEAALMAEGFALAGGSALALSSRREAVQWLCDNTLPGDRVLVKGSRSAGMEEVVRGLRRQIGDLD